MLTHRLNWMPIVQGSNAISTHTDYVNGYKSVLQTTSYNFFKTHTTGEVCAGVVKPIRVYPQNPTQHFCDLAMLEMMLELQPAFVNMLQ